MVGRPGGGGTRTPKLIVFGVVVVRESFPNRTMVPRFVESQCGFIQNSMVPVDPMRDAGTLKTFPLELRSNAPWVDGDRTETLSSGAGTWTAFV